MRHFRLPLALLVVLTVACSAHAQTSLPTSTSNSTSEPLINRQPEKPAWEIDVTDRLLQVLEGSAQNVLSGRAVPIAQTFSRANRRATLPAPGLGFWFRVPVALPAQSDAKWPVVAEWDEGRLISSVALFTYRIYYTEARRAWIPEMPAPYVDVEVKP